MIFRRRSWGLWRYAVGGLLSEPIVLDRYRLVAPVGVDPAVNAQFWLATDTALRRDVGLAALRRTGEHGEGERAEAMLAGASRWGSFQHFGCARLLDVVGQGTGFGQPGLPADLVGLTISEWVPGSSLGEVLASGPLRTGDALAVLDPLARAAETAHRMGLTLGCSHPSRIRFDSQGAARQAFALPPPGATPGDDVRGLGATLYALLTGYWPLDCADAEFPGLPAAPRDAQGAVPPPNEIRPGLSLEVSALTMAALGAGASDTGVHTAAGVHTMLVHLMEQERESEQAPQSNMTSGLRISQWATASCEALRVRLLSGANNRRR